MSARGADNAQFRRRYLPYNIAIKLAVLAFIFVRDRRANIAVLASVILIFLLSYWHRA